MKCTTTNPTIRRKKTKRFQINYCTPIAESTTILKIILISKILGNHCSLRGRLEFLDEEKRFIPTF